MWSCLELRVGFVLLEYWFTECFNLLQWVCLKLVRLTIKDLSAIFLQCRMILTVIKDFYTYCTLFHTGLHFISVEMLVYLYTGPQFPGFVSYSQMALLQISHLDSLCSICVPMSDQFVDLSNDEVSNLSTYLTEQMSVTSSKDHSRSSCLIGMRVGGCWLPRISLRRMYSLNWEESTPPPHEPVIQNPLCCNRSNTCSHTQDKN